MKKYKISFFALLALVIIAIIVFVIFFKSSNAVKDTTTEDSSVKLTQSPTPELNPSVFPTPSESPELIAELYPATWNVNGETKYGYIDKSGAFVIKPAFDTASAFYDGAAIVMMNNKYCVIDEDGNVIFINDNSINDFRNGVAVFLKLDNNGNGLYGYVDSKGKVILEPQYKSASNFGEDDTAYVQMDSGIYAKIDKTGKVLENYELDKKYDYFWSIEDGYLLYADSNSFKYGVINIKGEEVFPPIYSEITYLGNDLFAMKEPRLESYEANMMAKQAIFNAKGEQLTEYILYDVSSYYNGYSSATNDTSTFFIGLDGKIVANLPKFEGKGTLRLFGDVISALLDEDQIYYTRDKAIIWQPANSYALSELLSIKTIKYKPIRNVLVKYPQIEGLTNTTVQGTINSMLKSIFTDSRKEIKQDDFLSVDDNFSAKLMNNLLIVERTGYDYYFGAAHGMPIMDYYYADLTTGDFYQLDDLFMEGSDYKTKINKLITDEITAASEESMYFPESFKGISATQPFRLEEDAIIIYFYPYDIAAYAAGFPEFTIPFEDITEFINTEGSFWKAFHE